jgi:hypothetical protein
VHGSFLSEGVVQASRENSAIIKNRGHIRRRGKPLAPPQARLVGKADGIFLVEAGALAQVAIPIDLWVGLH